MQGRYAGEVAAFAAAPSVAGRWVLEFREKGVLAVTAPPAYPGVVSGVLYAVQGAELRTDLFSQDLCSGQPLGRYAVTITTGGWALRSSTTRVPNGWRSWRPRRGRQPRSQVSTVEAAGACH